MSVAYVSSLLPLPVLYNKFKKWKITEVILSDVSLLKSYKTLFKNEIKIIIVPRKFLFQLIYILFKLIFCKLFNKKIYFFHECCWLTFDLLINLINNEAMFYPQVTMKSFVEHKYIGFNKFDIIIRIFKQKKNFKVYQYTKGNNEGQNIIHSCINYSKNIIVNKFKTTQNLRYNLSKYIKTNHKKALLIVGTEPVSNKSLIRTFNYFSKLLKKEGFEIDIKDHPNKAVRLNEDNLITGNVLNPYMPVEMIKDDYRVVIGCASTGLLKFRNRSYSIIEMLDMSDEEKKLRKIHLLSLKNGKLINFLEKNFDNKAFIKKL